MARRGFGGMTALRAALGAAVGVGEGLQQREILAAQRKKEEEAAALTRFNALQAAGFGLTPRRRIGETGAPMTAGLPPVAGAAPATPIGTALPATTAGATPPTGMVTPMSTALGAAETRSMTEPLRFAGMEFDLIDPQEVARQRQAQQLSLYEQQRAVDVRTEAEKEAVKRRAEADAKKQRVQSLVESGMSEPDAKKAVELEAKYGDMFMTPGVQAQIRGQDISAATARRGQDIAAATARRGQDLAQQREEAGTGRGEIQNGLQAMGTARASSALNLLQTNSRIMDQFEDNVLSGKAQITALQLEAARFALSGKTGSAVAEDRLAKGVPGVMPPNQALLRYVRAAKGISGAVREITPRGGSNLMMQMEQTLAGIGPAGTDVESVNQVRTFRNDILTGVQEGVRAMRGEKAPTQSSANPYR